jgi:AraC-like DNA-binding protein
LFGDFNVCFCTYFKKLNKFRFDSEIYDQYTLFCVKKGSFSYRIDNGKEEVLSEGEIVLCPPNKSFARKMITPAEFCMIKFTTNHLKTYTTHFKVFDILRFNYNMEMLEDCICGTTVTDKPVFLHFCRDIIYMLNHDKKPPSKFEKVRHHLEKNFNKDISISSLANDYGYSEVHFINQFKLYYNYTPKAYVTYLRLQKAKQLLSTTNMLSKEIAFMCGFNDELYFTRIFKKHTGLSPKQFRRYQI